MKRSGFKNGIILILILTGIAAVMLSPVFDLTDIQISGCGKLTEQWVKETAEALPGTNIFLFSGDKAIKKLTANPYVENVKFQKSYPHTLLITLTERELSGYVRYLDNTYLYIDGHGTVLEVSSFFTEQLPVVVGLNFSEFHIGERLSVKNSASFDVMVTLAHLFKKHDMEAQVIRMDVSDVKNIHLYISKIDIIFGDIKGADEKVRTIKTIWENFPDQSLAGTLDVSDTSASNYSFRILK